ncbi:MAG: sugar ABC transporter ATP-binding protein [Candidatus Zixiibacteriota bacterium]
MEKIRKAFPGVLAVDSGSLEVFTGEIHALVGENGAGKSTLIKVLTGVHHSDAGKIMFDGKYIQFDSPLKAQKAGIAAIYQEFSLIPRLPVRANLFLGREKTNAGFIDTNFEYRKARDLFERMGVEISPETLVADLDIAQQQLVEIARSLATDAKILVMDEPTAALTPREVENLLGILRELTERNIGIIFISHRLDEVLSIADRVTVMRDGNTIGTWKTTELTKEQLIEQMVGRPLEKEFPKAPPTLSDTCLEVRGLTGGQVKNVSFSVRRGEVLGLAGLMGAGRTDVARLIFGADPKSSGEILLDGQPVKINSPRDAIRHGVCLLTEDRKTQGLVLKASVKENFALPNLSQWSHLGFIDRSMERSRFLHHVESLDIRIAYADQPVENLSGGNQQKLLVARWLETNSKVIIFDEPTRGIDVGTKYEMYLLINDLAAEGKAVIVISSELPEVLGVSDRILVMREGRITGQIVDVDSATQEEIMALAI